MINTFDYDDVSSFGEKNLLVKKWKKNDVYHPLPLLFH